MKVHSSKSNPIRMKHIDHLEKIFSSYLVKDRSHFSRYAGSLGILILSFALIALLETFEISRLYSLMLMAITVAAVHGGIGPALLCSLIGAITVNIYFGVFQSNPEVSFFLTGSFWLRVAIYMMTSMVVASLICEIRKIYKVAEQAKIMAEFANTQKDALIRVIAHDLRNPIGVIMGYSDLLNMRKFPEEKVREMAQKISATSMELTLLIDDLLTSQNFDSLPAPAEKKIVRIDRLLATVIDAQSVYSARKGITIQFKNAGETQAKVAVKGDVRKIARIFQNLIDNAIKYSPIDSEIRIEMHTFFKKVHIRFIDKGPGVHPDDVPQLFKPWGKTRNEPSSREACSETVTHAARLEFCNHF